MRVGQRPGADGEVGTRHAGRGQLLVDDELLERRRRPGPTVRGQCGMIRPASASGARRSAACRPSRRPRATTARISSRQRVGLGGQVGGEVATGAGDGQRGHLVLERTDVAARRRSCRLAMARLR